jgi:hypothetical protein
MPVNPNYNYDPDCAKHRQDEIERLNSARSQDQENQRRERAKRGVFNGFEELIKISLQPESKIADFVAGGKDKVTDIILGEQGTNSGGSRVLNTVLGQTNTAARDAVGNASSAILGFISGGTLDLNNLDDHADTYSSAAILIENGIRQNQLANDRLEGIHCGPSPWATDLIRRGIKQKFLFVVEFRFSDQFINSMGKLDHAFMVKSCERPSVSFEYEDVNIYNYRTKVATKTTYQPLTMRFYEDATSHVTSFYELYLKTMSPIANVENTDQFEAEHNGVKAGMNWDSIPYRNRTPEGIDGSIGVSLFGASLGTISDSDVNGFGQFINGRNILKWVKIHHLYTNPLAKKSPRSGLPIGNGQDVGATQMDTYILLNPKITEMQLDELSMEESEKTEASFTFSYDGVHMHTLESTDGFRQNDGIRGINSGKTIQALYPIAPATTTAPKPDVTRDTEKEERDNPTLTEQLKRGILEPFSDTAVGQVITGVKANGGIGASINSIRTRLTGG